MRKAWTEIDLKGDGLQSANAFLAPRLKRRARAYALLALFPLGLHRDYLDSPLGAWTYRVVSVLALTLWPTAGPAASLVCMSLLAAAAVHDLLRIEHWVAERNKRMRIDAFLRRDHAPPPGYTGRQLDDPIEDYLREKDGERAGHGPIRPAQSDRRRHPSIAEQERRLRELATRRPGRSPDRGSDPTP